jgi:DNA-binding winged helix-turn-helix (wHTH) protein
MSSPQANPAARSIRFGVFELDVIAGELRKNGIRVRLQEQPLQILTVLLGRPGEVATREDLRQKLWPGDTFVDFDHSLNTAVNKIREALGDSASKPQFIETVARRGYRFIGTIDSDLPAQSLAAQPLPAQPMPQTPSKFHPELNIPLPHRAIPRGLFGLIQVMYLVFYLVALFHWRGADGAINLLLTGHAADTALITILISSAVGIVFRCYFISAISFDYQHLRKNFAHLFLAVLVLDELWALAPFLAAGKIGFGPAFAATAALLYVPFAERTLLRMAYPEE